MSPTPQASLVLPNYNGKALLEQNLPSVLEAAARRDAEVLVVDDGSEDGSLELLAERFPDVQALPLASHQGFIAAVNHGVDRASGRAVVLLNTDVVVEVDFLAPLLDALDEDTFAVSARSLTEEDRNEGLSLAFFDQGDLVVTQPGIDAPDRRHQRRCTNFHASGGFSAFDRDKFLQLGGLDPVYHPFYWEDVDLCYRAWKRGWRCIYEPESVVHHLSHGTISCYFSPDEVQKIYEGNKHTFIVKNITEESYLGAYLERLQRDLFRSPVTSTDRQRSWGAFEMLSRFKAVLAARAAAGPEEGEAAVHSESEVLELSANVPC